MDRTRYVSALADARHSARVWLVAATGLLLANIVLCIVLLSSDLREKTIVVPPHFDRPFSVRGDELSASYIEQMGRYFAQLLLSYQKQTARGQFDAALQYFDPRVYGEVKARLHAEADRIEHNDISSVYHITSMDIRGRSAVITGEQIGIVGKKIVHRTPKSYSMTFRYTEGQLYIARFDEAAIDHQQHANVGGESR